MKIVSEYTARKLGRKTERFDRGKYADKPISEYYGLDVPDFPGVIAVFPSRRKDSYGKYVALMCVVQEN